MTDVLVIFVVWFLTHTIFILAEGLRDGLKGVKNCDLAVVLGNKIELNGKPSDKLKARLNKALELYQNGTVKNLLMIGAVGKEGFNEAQVMRDYAIKNGVSESNMLVDSQGYNSQQTTLNTKKNSRPKRL